MKGFLQHRLFWPLVTLLLLLGLNAAFSSSFLHIEWREGHLYGSLIDILKGAAPLILVSLGMTLVIATRGIDISVGATVAIAAAGCGNGIGVMSMAGLALMMPSPQTAAGRLAQPTRVRRNSGDCNSITANTTPALTTRLTSGGTPRE